MNVIELERQLAQRGFNVCTIYTGDGNPEDRYAIILEGNLWNVYYTERGERFELQQFSTETEACEYLLSLFNRDQTIWNMPSG